MAVNNVQKEAVVLSLQGKHLAAGSEEYCKRQTG
jgi:hypothetical protein